MNLLHLPRKLLAFSLVLSLASGAVAQPGKGDGGSSDEAPAREKGREGAREKEPGAKEPQGPASLPAAVAKWEEGSLTEALPLYKKALEEGGMFPSDVVMAYARIGTVQALTKNKEAALSSFRVAAVIDPAFQLPTESGPLAKKLYEEARKQAAKQGGKLEISAEVPERVDAQKSFSVMARLPEAFAPVVDKIGIEVKDSMGRGVGFRSDQPAAQEVKFDVPGKYVGGSTTLVVRVSAQDSHGNRWAMHEARVKTREAKVIEAPVVEAPPEEKKSSGFFSTPWPYVIGGAVLVAGGLGVFFVTRPPSEVNVGAPTWR